MRIQHIIAFAGDRRPFYIDDRQRTRTVFLGQTQSRQGIDGFPGLGDYDRQVFFMDQWRIVTEFRSDMHRHRNPQNRFDNRLSDHPGIHGGTAGYNGYFFTIQKHRIIHSVPAKIRQPVKQTRPYRMFHRLRLLVDLLDHKMRIAAFLRRFNVPVYRQ